MPQQASPLEPDPSQTPTEHPDKEAAPLDERTAHAMSRGQLEASWSQQRERLEQAAEDLASVRDEYAELYDFAPVGYLTIDAERRVLKANILVADLLGTDKSLLPGQELSRFVLAADQEPFRLACRRARDTQEVQVTEVQLRSSDGRTFEAEMGVSAPVLGDDTALGPLRIVVSDVTRRKQAEAALRRHQQDLRSLAHALTVAEEQERRRLAGELHDRVGQALVLAQMKAKGLRRGIAPGTAASGELEALIAALDEVDESVHSVIQELSPPVLTQAGFGAAVTWLSEHLESQGLLHVDVEDDGQPKPLGPDVGALMYRTVRELLTNVAKHARTNRARVAMGRHADHLRIEVSDSGVGFDPDQQQEVSQAFGLFSIRERLEFVGGRCQVCSAPGQGTTVILEVPLDAPTDPGA